MPGQDGGPVTVTLIIWDIDGDFGESIFQHIYIRGASSALVIGDASEPVQPRLRRAAGGRVSGASPRPPRRPGDQ